MTITSSPTATVAPSSTRCRATTPSTGASNSSSSLSVATSPMTSPSDTGPPGWTFQATMIPSSIVRPHLGRGYALAMTSPTSRRGGPVADQLADGLGDPFGPRQDVMLHHRRVGHRGVHAADAHHGCAEQVEAFRGRECRNLGAKSATDRSLVRDRQPSGLLQRSAQAGAVERDQRARVPDLTVDAILGEDIGRGQAVFECLEIGHQCDVTALAVDPSPAEGDRIHRHDLDAGDVDEPGLEAL